VRIGLDIRALQLGHRYRGIGVVTASLLEALPVEEHEYVLYRFQGSAPERDVALPEGLVHEVVALGRPPRRTLPRALRTALPGYRIPVAAQRLDAFLQPDAAQGYPAGVPVAAIGYDVIPLLFPDEYLPRPSAAALVRHGPRRLLAAALLRRTAYERLAGADRVIAISAATKRDLCALVPGVRPEHVQVAHLAAGPSFRPVASRGAQERHGITKPYLLYTGGIDPRKNVLALVRAHERVRRDHDVQLVLVGRTFVADNGAAEHRPLLDAIATSSSAADIVRPGYVAIQDLVELYSGAAALVFPTRYEGFGLPVLEAMACRCPVITFDHSSLREVAGDAAVLLGEGDDLAAAIDRLLSDPELAERLADRGQARSAGFRWDDFARTAVRVLEELAFAVRTDPVR